MSLNCQLNLVRFQWCIRGQVQGVGFRPFVYRVARQFHLTGFVRNDVSGVLVECQGEQGDLLEFEKAIIDSHPPSAKIRVIHRRSINLEPRESEFQIRPSDREMIGRAEVMVDLATCSDCIREIFSPEDRRYGYALTNCTQCGPRYSIIRRVPYDRCNTTMHRFEMCPPCRDEYDDPDDRRFHAQPVACHECGPRVELVDSRGIRIDGDPIAVCRQMLLDGKIVAIKGIGGFHLAVRADDQQAVLNLRTRKRRDHKPFAVMAGSMEQMRQLLRLSPAGERAARSLAAPILLAERLEPCCVAPAVAPQNHRLGVLLPYTPLHHLLFHQTPALPPLVMTSGNISDEPMVTDNCDALSRLGRLCDAILWHDRPIQRGVDDSILSDLDEGDPIPIRRARGFAPAAILLPVSGRRCGLCTGGELKNTIAVVRDGSAALSHHLGDLTHAAAYGAFRAAIEDLQELFGVQPEWVAHDRHPMYLSTTWARQLAHQLGVPLVPIQHHHAHVASVLAEHGIRETVLAVVCDGTGYGDDGTIWGGELFAANLNQYQRLANLQPLRLPGGDAAARDTTRCALALLYQAFGDRFADLPITRRLIPDDSTRMILCQMILRNCCSATSSGAGRVFDGIAALLGVCQHNQFEAQAAMLLESMAAPAQREAETEAAAFFEVTDGDVRQIHLAPLIRELVLRINRNEPPEAMAALFHEQFARAWSRTVVDASRCLNLQTVALSGGVFCNAIVLKRLTRLLESAGMRVLRNTLVPPNDGGIALGQAAIAAAQMAPARRECA